MVRFNERDVEDIVESRVGGRQLECDVVAVIDGEDLERAEPSVVELLGWTRRRDVPSQKHN